MRVLLSWLNDLAPFGDDVEHLADSLSLLGMAVEEIERAGTAVEGVIVAQVLALRPHPNADRMQIVDVDTGDGQPLQICCGAFNMAVGDKVPLATIGTTMPEGWVITRAKKRGEWSNGMLCSASELELGGDHGGIVILPSSLPLGAPVFEALGVTSDVVFDLDLTRNRPDAWSHLGVARDLAAQLGAVMTPPSPPELTIGEAVTVPVEILAPELCGRFTATVLTGVEVGPSAPWMAERLTRAGMRPINNVVDVSNYVMLELGQPNHPYDRRKLADGGFRIRRAADAERLETLDGVERGLTPEDLLICDGTNRPIGIAGIMGGANTEIDDTTTEVVLEAAWFQPLAVAHTAGRLGLRTEASARFERGVDHLVADLAIARFAELLGETCPNLARRPGAVDARGELPSTTTVALRPARVEAILGVTIDTAEIVRLLDSVGFAVSMPPAPRSAEATSATGTPPLVVSVPSWRPDCELEIDLIEEVARHYGYARLGKTVPTSAHPGMLTPHQHDRRMVRSVLVGVGLAEAMPNPLLGPGDHERAGLPGDAIAITNPMAAEESLLRRSLRPGLLEALAYNTSHRRTGVGLFEVGHVFGHPTPATEPLPDEREVVGVALGGRDAMAAVAIWQELSAALGVEGIEVVAASPPGLHPTRSARLVGATGDDVGLVGEIDPDVCQAHGLAERVAWLEFDLERLLGGRRGDRVARRVSRFPSSDLDLAFVVADEVPAAAVAEAITTAAGPLLAKLALFDVYRGQGVQEGARSLAYRLRLQAGDRTLTDADVGVLRQAVVDAAARLGAVLRA